MYVVNESRHFPLSPIALHTADNMDAAIEWIKANRKIFDVTLDEDGHDAADAV